MEIALPTLIALSLAACGTQPSTDDHVFQQREREPQPTLTIQVVEYENLDDLRRSSPPGHVRNGHELHAWGSMNISGTRCTIHVLRPERSYKPEWIGHEAAHCFWGRWHS